MRFSILVAVMFTGLTVWALVSACGPPLPVDPPKEIPSVQVMANCRNALGGQVTHHDAGLAGIEVQLLDPNGSRVAQTRTDHDGQYGFQDICPGTYTVCPGTPCPIREEVLPSRYAPASIEVSVPPIVQNDLDFEQLEPPPLFEEER